MRNLTFSNLAPIFQFFGANFFKFGAIFSVFGAKILFSLQMFLVIVTSVDRVDFVDGTQPDAFLLRLRQPDVHDIKLFSSLKLCLNVRFQ
jgi:hypothetical protein